MLIGIDGSRAFLKQRTGIEEYSYQVIKHLRDKLPNAEVVLYLRRDQAVNFDLPADWRIKFIRFPYLWTQAGLSLEMILHPAAVLFVPAHTVPLKHPENTVVTIHGLEYEFCPEAYSFWAKKYMRWSIKNSCRWAKTIISVSENTKKDLIKLYGVPEEKIRVIHEGYDRNFQFPPPAGGSNFQSNHNDKISKPYLLFVGRLEERKNIAGIIRTFEILKEKYQIPHQLVLAGKPGFGYEKINQKLQTTNYKKDIFLPGFVTDEKKWELLKNADAFLFPTFYEGFGIPVLEAQSVGVPVVASSNSSLEEVCDHSAVMVDPNEPEEIAERTNVLLSDKFYQNDIIKRGYENVKRFSWEKCAQEVAEILTEK